MFLRNDYVLLGHAPSVRPQDIRKWTDPTTKSCVPCREKAQRPPLTDMTQEQKIVKAAMLASGRLDCHSGNCPACPPRSGIVGDVTPSSWEVGRINNRNRAGRNGERKNVAQHHGDWRRSPGNMDPKKNRQRSRRLRCVSDQSQISSGGSPQKSRKLGPKQMEGPGNLFNGGNSPHPAPKKIGRPQRKRQIARGEEMKKKRI